MGRAAQLALLALAAALLAAACGGAESTNGTTAGQTTAAGGATSATVTALAPTRTTPAAARPRFGVTLAAPTHRPKVSRKWPYRVRVTDNAGKPIPARLTVQIVDPLGGVHPVQFGDTTTDITNRRIGGSFGDYVIWPPESKGYRLVFRVTVKAKGTVRRVTYRVRPR